MVKGSNEWWKGLGKELEIDIEEFNNNSKLD